MGRRRRAGNINAMIRFVITSICDMAGIKILIGSLLGPCSFFFPIGRLTVYTLISCWSVLSAALMDLMMVKKIARYRAFLAD